MSSRILWVTVVAALFVMGFARGVTLATGGPAARTPASCRLGCPEADAAAAAGRYAHLVPLRPIAWQPAKEDAR